MTGSVCPPSWREARLGWTAPPLLSGCYNAGMHDSRRDTEINTTDEERVALDVVTPCLGRRAHFRHVTDAEIECVHGVSRPLHEAEGAVRQFELRQSTRTRGHINTDDLAPMRGKPGGIGALHLHARDRLRHLLANVLLPVGSSRRIDAEHV